MQTYLDVIYATLKQTYRLVTPNSNIQRTTFLSNFNYPNDPFQCIFPVDVVLPYAMSFLPMLFK